MTEPQSLPKVAGAPPPPSKARGGGLTPPSSGRPKACFASFRPPLMSNVMPLKIQRWHTQGSVAHAKVYSVARLASAWRCNRAAWFSRERRVLGRRGGAVCTPRPLHAGAAALVSFGTRGWRRHTRKKTPSSMRTRVPCVSQQRCRLSPWLQSTLLGARGASQCTACRCSAAYRQASLLFEQRGRCGLAHSGITPPSSGHTTAGSDCALRRRHLRRCMPLMSNVRRHMQRPLHS